MGLHVRSKLVHILFKGIPLHEQGLIYGVIVLIEMG